MVNTMIDNKLALFDSLAIKNPKYSQISTWYDENRGWIIRDPVTYNLTSDGSGVMPMDYISRLLHQYHLEILWAK